MRILSRVTLFLFAIIALSCESKEKEVEELKSETIAIHDEVMPKMDDIMKLKKSLKNKQDSADASDIIQDLIIALEESDKAMMNWMRNYDPRMEDMTEDEKIEYLNSQKAAISEVSREMNKSIAEAEEFLK
ncbi:hypothetical protein SAMN05661096_02753 [Marivirga sericea]|uniref:Viral A-type inclusion protein n=1 Tax=Marivirga sericea TaxID=1028 RepID=A0A1X7KGQ3_9BACT|nr:hypothetical protein [Marivirga sericea]SMG40477.1 hypothetical protein SAMN05661096_02753 [Marivirga sericea]